MLLKSLQLIALVALAIASPAVKAADATLSATLFHGTSIVIAPDTGNSSPANSSYYAANFFCYMTDKGYFTFGWWVPADSHSDKSYCAPDSGSFHFYEHSRQTASDVDDGTAVFETQNVLVRPPSEADHFVFPKRALRYNIRALRLGNGPYGNMAVSFIDDGDVQFHAVGTRQTLSNNDDLRASAACRKAIHTLSTILQEHQLHDQLSFKLDQTICREPKLVRQGSVR